MNGNDVFLKCSRLPLRGQATAAPHSHFCEVAPAIAWRNIAAMQRPSVAFLLDIDGVLVRGHNALQCAAPALDAIEAAGCPYVFVTNSTGYTETAKARAIAAILGRAVDASKMIMAHSSMRSPLKPLQICGVCPSYRRRVRGALPTMFLCNTLCMYGWSAADTVQELIERQPQLYPSSAACKVSSECSHRAHTEPPYAAVVLLEMPANWGETIQVLVDVVRGDGQIGRDCVQTIPFHCGNPDFDYKDVHSVPRMTLGAFRAALDALYEKATGRTLIYTLHGKPFPATYELALENFKQQTRSEALPERIICVGDNPVSDIQGANNMGGCFKSALVRTGVWQGEEATDASVMPWRVYDDVLECVRGVLSDADGVSS